MIYQLDTNLNPYPLYPWVKIFAGLSIQQFNNLYNSLSFPFTPTDTLSQIAYAFTLIHAIMRSNEEYKIPLKHIVNEQNILIIQNNFLSGISLDDNILEKQEILFKNVFYQLEKHNHAKETYLWGRETRSYLKCTDMQKFSNLNVINNRFHFLRKWAVLEWNKQPVLSKPSMKPWDTLISKYIPIYTSESQQFNQMPISPIPLSKSLSEKIQAIVFKYETQKMNLNIFIDDIMESPRNVWTDFVLRNLGLSTWLKMEGQYRINLKAWKTIIEILSTNDLQKLRNWSSEHEDIFSNFQ